MTGATAPGSVPAALARLRVSFFMSVALVSPLLTQVLGGVGDVWSWWLWILVLAAARSLAAYIAAVQAAVPAIYTSSTPRRLPGDPRHVHAVVAVHDPDNVLGSPDGPDRTGSPDHG